MKREWQLEVRVEDEWRVVARERDWDLQNLVVHIVGEMGVPAYRVVQRRAGLNGRSGGRLPALVAYAPSASSRDDTASQAVANCSSWATRSPT